MKFKYKYEHWHLIILGLALLLFYQGGYLKPFIGAVMTTEEKTLCTDTGGTIVTSSLAPNPTLTPNKALTYVSGQTNVYPFCALQGIPFATAEDICLAYSTVDTVTKINDDLTFTGHPCGTPVNNFEIIEGKKYYVAITADTLLNPGDYIYGVCGVYSLQQGWNDILLVQSGSYDIIQLLSDLNGKYDDVWAWDCTDATDPWKEYVPGAPGGNDLSVINQNHNYIFKIRMTEPVGFVSDRIIEIGQFTSTNNIGSVFNKYWDESAQCPVPRTEVCDCGENGVWGTDGCGYITPPECTVGTDCPSNICPSTSDTPGKVISGYCSNSICTQTTSWANACCFTHIWDGSKCAPAMCPTICVPMYAISNGACVYNACGSGCGPDNINKFINTFTTKEMCECKLKGGEWVQITTFSGLAPASYCSIPSDQICCKIFGYGTEMKEVNVHYEKTARDQCKVPIGMTGGGRTIVDDSFCEEKPETPYWIYVIVGGLVIALIYLLYPRRKKVS